MVLGVLMALMVAASGAAVEAGVPKMLAELQRIVDEPGEIVTQLDNGMVVIAHRHSAAPVVAVRMYVKTGSIYEQEHLGCGLSHLYEHLLHGGTTTTRTETESRAILDRIGSQSNAYTTKDHTCYYIETANQFLPEAVNLLADWITRPAFDATEFQREWGVVQRELEMHQDDPGRQLYYLTWENVYKVHPARLPVIGYKPVVQTVTLDAIKAYHKRMYVPDNVVFSITGDIDPEAAVAVARAEFADFARRPVPDIVLPDEPAQVTARALVKAMDVEDCRVSISWPTIRLTDPDLYALDVVSDVLSRGRLSRLVRRVVIEEQLASSLTSYSYTPHWAPGVFDIQFVCKPESKGAVVAAIDEEVAKLKTDLVSEAELARVKRLTISHHAYSKQTAADIGADLATSLMATGDPHFDDAYVANIQKVTPEQVRAMAQKYLVAHHRNTTMILPKATVAADETAADASAKAPGTRRLTLDNGLRVLIRPDDAVGVVAVQVYFNGGLLSETAADNGIANLMVQATRYGTTTRTFEQIAELTESRGIEIGMGSGRNTFFYTALCLPDDVGQAIDLLADMVMRPSFPAEYVGMLKQQVAAGIRQIDDRWQSQLSDFFHQAFFKASPYRMRPQGTLTSVEGLTAEALKGYHDARVRGPEAVLAVYGKVDADEVAKLVTAQFGALPGESSAAVGMVEPDAAIGSPVAYVMRSNHSQTAGVMVGYRGHRVTDVADRYPLMVLDTMVGGYHYPGGWLHNSLRGKDPHTGETRDLVYAVHFVDRAWVLPGYLAVVAGCQPGKVNEVVGLVLDKMARARAGTFEQAEFETAKDLIVAADALDRQTNADLAAQACLDDLYGLGYDFSEGNAARIRQVTMEDVRRVAGEYLTQPIICITTPSPEGVALPFETKSWPTVSSVAKGVSDE